MKETIVVLSVCIGLICAIVCAFDYADCRGFEYGTGIKTKWTFGCYAQVNEQWVPKQYAFGDAHERRIK